MAFWDEFGRAAKASTLPGIAGMFYDNPADASRQYVEQIPGRTRPYFDPYIQQGQRVGGMLEGQYGDLLSDPGGMLNRFGQGYQQSPGFEFALKRALEAGNRSAAAGGMAGSPMHQEQNMATATGMANQDYMNWLDRTLGLYGRGMGGAESMYGTGFKASQSMADMIAQALSEQGGLEYAGGANRNAFISKILEQIMKGAGTIATGGLPSGGSI